ncbi:MAG: hypothetical protein AAB966_03520 [Patescibacteria group bacterium]
MPEDVGEIFTKVHDAYRKAQVDGHLTRKSQINNPAAELAGY